MEKINALIEKLQELKNSGADLTAISYYVQLLQAEVLHARTRQHQQQTASYQGNIAVIMPAQQPITVTMPLATSSQTTTLPSNKPPEVPTVVEVKQIAEANPVAEVKPIVEYVKPEAEIKSATEAEPAQMKPVAEVKPLVEEVKPVTEAEPVIETKPAVEEVKPVIEAKPVVTAQPAEVEDINTRAARLNDAPTFNITNTTEDINTKAARTQAPPVNTEVPPAADLVPPKPEPVITAQPIPTLAVNQPVAEKQKTVQAATLFDEIPNTKNGQHYATAGELRKDLNDLVGTNGLSLNDSLRHQQTELAQKLGEMPVNDLRHAIGINDKYQFIQELFRGDKDLYERSIKTINECSNLQEADYWIQREIKIIQGWEDDHHLVQQFYSLLKKRFS